RPRDGQYHIHTFCDRLQIDVQDGAYPERIEERDRSLVDGVLVPEENQIARGDTHAPGHTWVRGGASQPQVGTCLQVLSEWRVEGRGIGSPDAHVKTHARQRTARRGGNTRGR